jgi:hypothetical protein
MKSAPTARDLLAAGEVLKGMSARHRRELPYDVPTSFVRKRWVRSWWARRMPPAAGAPLVEYQVMGLPHPHNVCRLNVGPARRALVEAKAARVEGKDTVTVARPGGTLIVDQADLAPVVELHPRLDREGIEIVTARGCPGPHT